METKMAFRMLLFFSYMLLPILALTLRARSELSLHSKSNSAAIFQKRRVRSPLQMNVWSNPQAVLDYQQYLDGASSIETKDCDSIIIVGNRDKEKAWAK